MLCPNATSPGATAEEGRGPLVGEVDERRRSLGRPVRRADVRVVVAQVGGDRVDHLVRALRAARAVEEREPAVERREARADGGDVEQRGAHAVRKSGIRRSGSRPRGSPPAVGQTPEGVRCRGRNRCVVARPSVMPPATCTSASPSATRRRSNPARLREQLADDAVVGLRLERDVRLELRRGRTRTARPPRDG